MKLIQQFFIRPWLYIIILIIGISLKIYRIEYRYFWFDEISTIGHTSGNQIFNSPINEIKNINFFKNQLHLKTQDQKIGSQLKGLYSSVNLNPLHYTFLMFWYRIAGDDDMSYRYFNIFIFILTLPILFFLAKSLFKSKLAGWIIVSLYVFSPFFHFYAHEARYNILLIFLISLLHYLFLQSIEFKKLQWWTLYSLVGILALYASVMSGIIIFGHLIYILFLKKEARLIYSISLLIILLAYLPWILSMLNNSHEITSSLAWHELYKIDQNFLKIFLAQFIGFTKIFSALAVNWEYHRLIRYYVFSNAAFIQLILDIIFIFFILITVIYTVRKAPFKVWFFLFTIVIPHILFYFVSDLVRNSGASYIWRYHALNYIGILLFVAYFLSKKIETGKHIYSGIYLIIIIIGFVSILNISKDRCYSIPLNCEQNINVAELFSKAENPLLISDYSMRLNTGTAGFFTLLNRCESNSIDILHASPDIKNIEEMLTDKDYSEIYVTYASDELMQNLKSQFGERMDSLEIEGIDPTWQIKLNENLSTDN